MIALDPRLTTRPTQVHDLKCFVRMGDNRQSPEVAPEAEEEIRRAAVAAVGFLGGGDTKSYDDDEDLFRRAR